MFLSCEISIIFLFVLLVFPKAVHERYVFGWCRTVEMVEGDSLLEELVLFLFLLNNFKIENQVNIIFCRSEYSRGNMIYKQNYTQVMLLYLFVQKKRLDRINNLTITFFLISTFYPQVHTTLFKMSKNMIRNYRGILEKLSALIHASFMCIIFICPFQIINRNQLLRLDLEELKDK